jgi:hypothetical protein
MTKVANVNLTELVKISIRIEKTPAGKKLGTIDIPILALKLYLNVEIELGSLVIEAHFEIL